ncbi:integrase catalytic domain-containing protein [Trichonephila clavipes]|nr:integrase catalytic domain-containing protein [Trichonephila clavipes]
MEVNDQKNICLEISRINDSRVLQKLATNNIFISDSPENNKLCLFEKYSDEIHILLGSDIVGKLFTGIKDPSEKKSKLELQDLALKHFENTVLRDDEGRYIVSIPWIEGNEKLEDHYSLAKGKLEKTVKTLKLTGRLFDYEQIFVDWEKEGIIEKIAQDKPKNGGKFHYLPHRSVFKENSTTEIRPVFDGSAHHGKSCSLNDCIEKGPNLIKMIPAILNRFLLGKIGVISDIRKAFLQILDTSDTYYLSCAAVLNHHFKQAPEHLEKTAEKLIDSMFVDSCVASVDSSEELESFQRDSTELLALGKFDLHGWRHSDIESNFDFQDNQQKSDPRRNSSS